MDFQMGIIVGGKSLKLAFQFEFGKEFGEVVFQLGDMGYGGYQVGVFCLGEVVGLYLYLVGREGFFLVFFDVVYFFCEVYRFIINVQLFFQFMVEVDDVMVVFYEWDKVVLVYDIGSVKGGWLGCGVFEDELA